MKRLSFIVLCIATLIGAGLTSYFVIFAQEKHKHVQVNNLSSDDDDGRKNSATVTFGGWMTNTPIDRFPNNANTQFPRTQNHHALTPEIAKIKAGGTVNFIIGGFHVVTVYGNGTRPQDIDTTRIVPPPHPGPPIIDDSRNRIYRGLDPTLLPAIVAQDRVETVQFDTPGTYLVICSVLPHFQDGMFGYVRVTPNKGDDDGKVSKN